MTKIIISLILTINYGFAQDLSKQDFQKIKADVDKLVYYIRESNSLEVNKIINLDTSENSKKIEELFTQKEIKLNDYENNYFVFPHYTETSEKNKLHLTITAFKQLSKKENEKFIRAVYYFVFNSIVQINEQNNIEYLNQKYLITKQDINDWWLNQYKTYNENTNIIHDKYGFVPPPPPWVPLTLK